MLASDRGSFAQDVIRAIAAELFRNGLDLLLRTDWDFQRLEVRRQLLG